MKHLPSKLTLFFVLTIFANQASAQIWKKIKKGAKDVQDAAKQVTNTTKEVTNTVNAAKEFKKSWTKDTSSNIRYNQIPDYRSREEVSISKKQKLSVENGEFVNLSWSPVTKFDNQIFPSFIIGWANYKGQKDEDMGSSLGFRINTSLSNVILKWEIECSDKNFFSNDSGYINCDLLKSGNLFLPKIDWNYRFLTKHQSNAPVNLHFRLTDPNTGSKVERLVSINLRSINDCLLSYNGTKFHYLFATYVNEDHPEIDKILKDMLNTKMIDAVLGYQMGPSFVDMQVAALWRVLHDKGFQYSSITDNSGNGEDKGVFSQTVRTFDKSLQTTQANCVDGTVLFASILKKMGIRPILVTVPGHCFLGYYADDTTTTNIKFLETTMMSSSAFVSNPKASVQKYNDVLTKTIPKGVKLSELNKAYFLEFLNAKATGMSTFNSKMEKYGSKYVSLLDVNDLRKYVKPIPTYDE